jgi:capsular exopolysaccharide synthesis family protein
VPLEDALQDTGVDGLQVIASGPRPPAPAELLNSVRMQDLIRQLSQMADLVIFDTPPCLAVTDAQAMATRVDGVILVLDVGEAKKGDLRRAKGLLDQAHARTLGLVFNKVSRETSEEYDHYYNSSYYDDLGLEHTNGKREQRRLRALAPARSRETELPDERRSRRSHRRTADEEEF